MDYMFCPYCGSLLQKKMDGDRKRLYCKRCNITHYKNPTAGVAVIIIEKNKLLLVKRSGSYNGMWCIPCGHVEWGEDIRSAARRELKEETGLKATIGAVFTAHSNFHDLENQTVGIWFWGKWIGGELQTGSEISEAGFFPIDALPEPMAFPTDILVCEELICCTDKDALS